MYTYKIQAHRANSSWKMGLFLNTLSSQTITEKACIWKLAHKTWFDALAKNEIKPIIDSLFTLKQIEEAQEYMQKGIHFGKIAIKVS